MSLKQQITEDMKTAMRAKDAQRLSAIRLLLAAMKQRVGAWGNNDRPPRLSDDSHRITRNTRSEEGDDRLRERNDNESNPYPDVLNGCRGLSR